MFGWFKKLVGRIDAVADRPADPAALSGWRDSRRGGRAAAPIPPAAAHVELDPVLRRSRSARPDLEGQEAIDAILAEQRSRMRGQKRRGSNGG